MGIRPQVPGLSWRSGFRHSVLRFRKANVFLVHGAFHATVVVHVDATREFVRGEQNRRHGR